MAPIFLTDGSGKFIRQRLFSYWKALICGVVAKCKICVQFCVQFPDLTYVNISDLMHTICTIAFSRHFLCFWEVVGFYFGFKQLLISCRTSYGILAALPIWCWLPHSLFYATGQTHQKNLRRLRILSSWNQPIILTRISQISQKARRFARACRHRRRREWASVATTAGLSAPRSAACSPFNRMVSCEPFAMQSSRD